MSEEETKKRLEAVEDDTTKLMLNTRDLDKRVEALEGRIIIHKVILIDDLWRYLCNQACGTTITKSTHQDEHVTCLNCLREIEKEKKK